MLPPGPVSIAVLRFDTQSIAVWLPRKATTSSLPLEVLRSSTAPKPVVSFSAKAPDRPVNPATAQNSSRLAAAGSRLARFCEAASEPLMRAVALALSTLSWTRVHED